jgi:hypothetical protein
VKTKKADKLSPLWDRFEKSGAIEDYLKYHKAKRVKAPKAGTKTLAKRKKASS